MPHGQDVVGDLGRLRHRRFDHDEEVELLTRLEPFYAEVAGRSVARTPELDEAALDAMDILTFYGRVKFDTTAEAHGLQIGHSMIYIQWQRDDASNLMKQVVWPLEGATADTIYPVR